MQIKFNRVSKQDGKPDQQDMAAQLRAAQQSGVQPRNPQQQMPGMEPLTPPNPQQGMAQRPTATPGNSQQFNPQNPQQTMAQRPAAAPGNSQQFNPQNPQQAMAQRPAAVQGNTPQPTPQSPQQTAAQNTNQDKFSEILASQAQEAGLKPPQPKAETAEKAPTEEKPAEAPEKNEEKTEVTAAPKKSGGPTLEDILKGFIGQSIRVHTADHENCAGRLETVENGWIKLVNVRSAGTDYYADEDMISISHIVKVRASRPIEKEYYNQYMNR